MLLIIIALVTQATEAATPPSKTKPSDEQAIKELKERLKRLEPETPKDINDDDIQFPSKLMKEPSEMIQSGEKLPYKIIMDNPQWERPLYKSEWHSTYSGGRWSYVPLRLKFAQHRIFAAPTATLSNLYDLSS
ncbi:hypothetical protein ACVNS2_16785 [Paenibacillus caseinilyticus]|uniref:hypothetical protein n=1 Tax=Paenibacillus mucilaginosus TaxID=61624 RepID=UPI000FFE617D|nr:hypothetical protein [Paenibacillus mucilaginosus]